MIFQNSCGSGTCEHLGWLGLAQNLSQEIAVRCWLGLYSSEGSTGAGGSTSEEAGKLAPAVGWRPQFLSLWASPQSCLSVLTMWQLASPGISDSRHWTGRCKCSRHTQTTLIQKGMVAKRRGFWSLVTRAYCVFSRKQTTLVTACDKHTGVTFLWWGFISQSPIGLDLSQTIHVPCWFLSLGTVPSLRFFIFEMGSNSCHVVWCENWIQDLISDIFFLSSQPTPI